MIDGLDKLLQTGENSVDLQLESGITLPFSMDVVYKTTTPETSKNCGVRLNTKLQNRKVDMGETIALVANLENLKDEGQAMTLVRLGIPAGLRPQAWQLKELREKGVIDFYETTAREVIIYYRGLAPNAKKKVSLDLRADLPGTFTGIASSAYLYYNPRAKSWTQPLKIKVDGSPDENAEDAVRGKREGLISETDFDQIVRAEENRTTPPMTTPLGGWIEIHGDGTGGKSNWTRGCIAIMNEYR